MSKRIKRDELRAFCQKCCEKEGMPPRDAEITAKVLCETDCLGVNSHGTKNLYGYIKKKRAGGMSFLSELEVIKQGLAYALLDAHEGIGMVAGYKAMEMAVDKAAVSGVALVTVRNSTHFGAAGYYANMAVKRGMFGLAISNVDPNMTVPGARGKVIGNNPLSFAAPIDGGASVFLDIAMSNVASLKVIQARKDGESIPSTWIVDKEGLPTTDPSHYPEEGAMQPFGGHKGYGLAVMTELLTGLLSGGEVSTSGGIKSWCFDLETPNRVCHTFLAVDVDKFCGSGCYSKRSSMLAGQLRSAPKAKDSERIYVPGEIEWENYRKHGELVELPEDVYSSLLEMSEDLGITITFEREGEEYEAL